LSTPALHATPAAPPTLGRIRVVLSQTSHPGNIGSAARAMKTMGLSKLVLVAPRLFPAWEATSLAAGADDVLGHALVVQSLDEALAGCAYAVAASARPRELIAAVIDARSAAAQLVAAAQGGGDGAPHEVAVVFGNETSGLSNEDARRCNALAHIPANPAYSSLNLAAAVQVFAYELRMAVDAAVPGPVGPQDVPATLDEIDGLLRHCESALTEIGFLKPDNPGRLMVRLQKLFGRARLEKEEVNILRGIMNAAVARRRRP
jgi:tRNA/rRNA methyltransferase